MIQSAYIYIYSQKVELRSSTANEGQHQFVGHVCRYTEWEARRKFTEISRQGITFDIVCLLNMIWWSVGASPNNFGAGVYNKI